MTIEQIRFVAAAIRVVNDGGWCYAHLGGQGAVDGLCALGARRRSTVYAPSPPYKETPYVIESAALDVDGVRMEAQFDRPATDEEAAQLSKAEPHGGPTVAVTL